MRFYRVHNRILCISGVILILLLTGCIDKYWPDSEFKYDKMLVVEGMISNLPGPYTVYLSSSAALDNPEFIPLSGYSVIISDDQGNMELLKQTAPGVYETSEEGIQGVIGRSYKLSMFSYDENSIYESAYELLKQRAVSAERSAAAEAAAEAKAKASTKSTRSSSRRQSTTEAMIKSAARSIGNSLGRQLVRGILGSLLGGKR